MYSCFVCCHILMRSNKIVLFPKFTKNTLNSFQQLPFEELQIKMNARNCKANEKKRQGCCCEELFYIMM